MRPERNNPPGTAGDFYVLNPSQTAEARMAEPIRFWVTQEQSLKHKCNNTW